MRPLEAGSFRGLKIRLTERPWHHISMARAEYSARRTEISNMDNATHTSAVRIPLPVVYKMLLLCEEFGKGPAFMVKLSVQKR